MYTMIFSVSPEPGEKWNAGPSFFLEKKCYYFPEQPLQKRMKKMTGTTPQQIVIIGNGIAGTTAAFALRDSGFEGTIVMVTDEEYPVYFRTRLPEIISGMITPEKLIMTDMAKHQAKKIDLRLKKKVVEIDGRAQRLRCADGESLPYDRLLLAMGARPNMPQSRESTAGRMSLPCEISRTARKSGRARRGKNTPSASAGEFSALKPLTIS